MILLQRLLGTFVLTMFVLPTPLYPQESEGELRWFRGNTHTHTLNSDGDSTPDEVVAWYREHGYHFLVLTDHNFVTGVDALNALHGADDRFLIIKGEEVSDSFAGKPLHINGLNLDQVVAPQGGQSVVEVLQNNVDAIRSERGVPHINHPNFRWSLTGSDLEAVQRYRLLEIFNGHPRVNNLGGGNRPSVEQIWDHLLSRGKRIYGIAVDDAHVFKRPWDREAARPGQGWVVVRAIELTSEAILSAMEAGHFYASTGVEIEDYQVSDLSMIVKIKPIGDTQYRTLFIGSGGKILTESSGRQSTYIFTGSEEYVRCKILDSNGNVAWLQPVFP